MYSFSLNRICIFFLLFFKSNSLKNQKQTKKTLMAFVLPKLVLKQCSSKQMKIENSFSKSTRESIRFLKNLIEELASVLAKSDFVYFSIGRALFRWTVSTRSLFILKTQRDVTCDYMRKQVFRYTYSCSKLIIRELL